MSAHIETQTMDVVIDGHLSVRPIQHYCTVTRRYEPELKDGELCLWTIGSDVPTIIETFR